MGSPRLFEQPNQLPEPGLRHVAKLAGMATADRFVEHFEEFESRLRQADFDDPPVRGWAVAADEPPFFQFVQQSRDIRSAGDESFRKGQGGEAARMLTAEEAAAHCIVAESARPIRKAALPRCGAGRTSATS